MGLFDLVKQNLFCHNFYSFLASLLVPPTAVSNHHLILQCNCFKHVHFSSLKRFAVFTGVSGEIQLLFQVIFTSRLCTEVSFL